MATKILDCLRFTYGVENWWTICNYVTEK
eukprot:COSAG01_NODE_48349_length_382_cov_0.717314_1_plen_28_part_10